MVGVSLQQSTRDENARERPVKLEQPIPKPAVGLSEKVPELPFPAFTGPTETPITGVTEQPPTKAGPPRFFGSGVSVPSSRTH